MLLNFRVDNGTSYQEGAFLDLEAAKVTGHEGSLIQQDNLSVLPVITIYGANGAGKTNLLRLMEVFFFYVLNSVDLKSDKKLASRYPFMPFNYCKRPQETAVEYEVTFFTDGREYRYMVALGIEAVREEILEYRKQAGSGSFLKLFARQRKNITLGSIVRAEASNIQFCNSMLAEKDLLLTVLGRREEEGTRGDEVSFRAICEWFEKLTYVENVSSQMPLRNIQKGSDEEVFYRSPDAVKFARLADPQIRTLALDGRLALDPESFTLFAGHKIVGEDSMRLVPALVESQGTQNLLKVAPVIHRALSEGGILLADELDGSMHPLLLLEIIKMFMDPQQNPKHAQLICTLHNVVIMDRRNLRRDSIWFVEKDDRGISEVYSLADVSINGAKVRNDADFCKNYVLGNYGASPNFGHDGGDMGR